MSRSLADRPVLTQGSPLTGKSGSRLSDSRQALEAAVEAALSLLDAIDGDGDLEPECWDEGAACEDEGAITGDDEPDHDACDDAHAELMDQRRLACHSARRPMSWRPARVSLEARPSSPADPDEDPDPYASPRCEWGMA